MAAKYGGAATVPPNTACLQLPRRNGGLEQIATSPTAT
jgi:hypothetical protein